MWSTKAIEQLDKYFPPCGACAFCGGKDARHRLWDAFMGRIAAGESARFIAKDMDYPLKAVNAVLTIKPYRRGGSQREHELEGR